MTPDAHVAAPTANPATAALDSFALGAVLDAVTPASAAWVPEFSYRDEAGAMREAGAVYLDAIGSGLVRLHVEGEGEAQCARCGRRFVAVPGLDAAACLERHICDQ